MSRVEKVAQWFIWTSWCCGVLTSVLDHTHGTTFVFMAPFCDEYFPVNVVVRWRYGARFRTVVTIKGTYKKFILSMGEEFPFTRLPCKQLKMNGITYSGAIVATSKEDIMVYVQYKQDNFLVFPITSLSKQYIVVTDLPSYMDKAFLAITTPSKSVVRIRIPRDMKSFVVFNEGRFYPGETISVSLSRYDVLMIDCECDLTGVNVESDTGVVVVSGSYKKSSTLVIIEECLSAGAWGKHFVLPIEFWMKNASLKILGRNNSIEELHISTDNQTESYQTTNGIFYFPIYAKEYIYVQSKSPIYVVYTLDVILTDKTYTMSILINGVPLEQFPKFLCDSFSTPTGATCFAGIGNGTHFQSMFYQPVETSQDGDWYFVIVQKDTGLVTIPKTKYVWSHSLRLSEEDRKRFIYSGAFRQSHLYDSCIMDTSAHIAVNDGMDNDCDGIVDEEYINSKDDDVDNNIDEDTSSNDAVCVVDYNYGQSPKTWILLSNPMIAILISIMIAVTGVGAFIGGSALIEILQGGHPTRPSRVEPVE
ncbi:hypothetical protein LOTGIDRAFT_172933 [Lottia gigantea]|uniref:IgGFc-binding protein N-terminal domain-containing protein n=1 Tax=Lottia gigantea TaxID=225164 RepID=V4CFW1_LOTGI|nr:hypothetical protein LOTGIDRAFT_172933 [Lottia gigantea]ESP00925.1 hypothetical protein LOTGIDRAFT_172933 [Lottia gigantea]